jgi:nudix-type nucleoside diphosphatase (YffH/AdpP family)
MAPRILQRTACYQGWTNISALRLRLDNGEEVTREVEDHGDAVAVLPYDPVRRVAMLVRLLRAPVLMTASAPDLIEAPAGLIEDEDVEETARREALEEAGLRLNELEFICQVWTMPGLSTERMSLFLAPYRAADRVAAGGGLAAEHENIEPIEIGLGQLWTMVERGELQDCKTLTLVMALRLRHPELF